MKYVSHADLKSRTINGTHMYPNYSALLIWSNSNNTLLPVPIILSVLPFEKGIASPFHHFTLPHLMMHLAKPIQSTDKANGAQSLQGWHSQRAGENCGNDPFPHTGKPLYKERSRGIWRGGQGPFPLSAPMDPEESRFLCKTKAVAGQIQTKSASGWLL